MKTKYPFLYAFQADAAAAAVNRGSFLIAHDMGLGKTLSSFAAAAELRDKHKLGGILIVCPASIQKQWVREIEKWFNQPSLIVAGSKKKREELWNSLEPIKIISYESLRMDWPRSIHRMVVIADEVSKIKNTSKINKVFQEVAKVAPCRIGVTGTPLTGRLEHYYRIAKWINPAWMSYKFFDANYTIKEEIFIGSDGDSIDKIVGYRNLADFVKRLEGMVDRKRKSEVATQLPPKTMEWRTIAFTSTQRALHSALLGYAEDREEGILPVWQLLHTVSDGTEVTMESTSEILRQIDTAKISSEESPKLKEIADIIEELGDEKVVIYTQFARFARHIQSYLNKAANTKVSVLATAEDTRERDASVAAFREVSAIKVLVSTDTLAMGISFSDVDYLINADIPADIGVFLQRCDRIHRIDSKYPKTIINLVSEGIEEDIYDIIMRKGALIEQVTESGVLMKVNIRHELEKKYGIRDRKNNEIGGLVS
jgi:SNF2 family DNA or RNA helicase